MIRKVALTAVAALYIFHCSAQGDAGIPDNNKVNIYAGVQANQLLNAIINLNANTAPVNNPYLFIASANWARYGGWGVEGGFGYNYEDVSSQLTPSNGESKINNVFYRGGIGRKVMLSKRFEIGFGLDYVGDFQLDQTFTSSVTNFGGGQSDSTVSVSVNKTTSSGYGAQVTLAFYITPKILLSTEATAVYLKSEVKENVTLTDYFNDVPNPTENSTTLSATNSDVIKKTVTFTLPIALFLVIKF